MQHRGIPQQGLRLLCVFVFVWLWLFAVSQCAYGNMAAPAQADIASSVTFAKNDSISVRSEVLDITVHGGTADIVATYSMQNTTDQPVSTPSMFLASNIQDGGVQVLVNGKKAVFQVESYALDYGTAISTGDWQYVVLTEENGTDISGQTVDSINFTMDFQPQESYDVAISYTYRLGGYPNYDYNAKIGYIDYYLTPAAMWKDFENLTINVYLDADMPVLASSNLPFQKVASRSYQYVSSTLPDENLTITVDQNWWQTVIGFFKNPYLAMLLTYTAPLILIILAAIAILVWFLCKKRKAKPM